VPIRPHLSELTAFEPPAIAAMSRAFENACAALHIPAGDIRGREIIATRVIDLARSGLLDTKALQDRVLAEARMAA